MTSRPVRVYQDDKGRLYIKSKKGKNTYIKTSLSREEIQKKFIKEWKSLKRDAKKLVRKKYGNRTYRTKPVLQTELDRKGDTKTTSTISDSKAPPPIGQRDPLYLTTIEKDKMKEDDVVKKLLEYQAVDRKETNMRLQLLDKQIIDNRLNNLLVNGVSLDKLKDNPETDRRLQEIENSITDLYQTGETFLKSMKAESKKKKVQPKPQVKIEQLVTPEIIREEKNATYDRIREESLKRLERETGTASGESKAGTAIGESKAGTAIGESKPTLLTFDTSYKPHKKTIDILKDAGIYSKNTKLKGNSYYDIVRSKEYKSSRISLINEAKQIIKSQPKSENKEQISKPEKPEKPEKQQKELSINPNDYINSYEYNNKYFKDYIKTVYEDLGLGDPKEFKSLDELTKEITWEEWVRQITDEGQISQLLGRGIEPISTIYPDESLFESEIRQIFKDYEHKFLPVIAHNEIHKIKYNKRTPTFFVMNLSDRGTEGTHWTSTYIDEKNDIYYFDSFGEPPNSKYKEDIKNLIGEGNVLNKIKYNTKSIQNPMSSDCGYYAIQFVENMLDGKSFSNSVKITENDLKDEKKHKEEWL